MTDQLSIVTYKKTNKKQIKRQKLPPIFFWKALPDPKPSKEISPLNIKLTASGFSLEGLKFNLNNLPSKLQTQLRYILSLSMIAEFIAGYDKQSYFFKDISNVTYKLYLSGVENLSIVIEQLRAGRCNTTDSDYYPDKLTEIESYYDQGGTVPVYAATLSREESGQTSELVHSCVSELIKNAHDERSSGSSLGIIFGVMGGVAIISGIAAYCYFKRRFSTKNTEEHEDTIPLKRV